MVRVKTAVIATILALGLVGASTGFAGPKNGGGGGHSKNGGGGGHSKNGGGGGGGGGSERTVIVCIMNGQKFYVRRESECGLTRVVVRHKVKKYTRTVRYQHHRARYCGPSVNKNGGDYVIGGGGFIGSPAAVAQARRRAGGATAFSGGGYGYGYVGEGAYYNEGEETVVVKRHKRKFRRGAVYSGGFSGYDSGVVLHYGPAIVKGGAY
jgi:hypothetical protein